MIHPWNEAKSLIMPFIGSEHWLHTLIAIAITLIAFLIGNVLKRRIRESASRSLKNDFIEFLTPLVPPLLSLALLGVAFTFIKHYEMPEAVFGFFLKLSVAWLAIRFVIMMSSRKSAGWFIVLVIAPVTLLQLFGLWEIVAELLSGLKFTFGNFTLTAYMVVKTIIALIVLFWLAGLMNKLSSRYIYRMQFVHYSHRTLITKIFQIFLYFIVFIIALQMLGINLTALSVLGGAIGVGIGFGLQKIASNFISGIILLFERSVQVDDLVELADGTFGYIRRTGARYTLLETFDGKEVLIPNEEFITQRMVSWTHSNTKARVQIAVGVKYGTDLEQALKILHDAAAEHPRCMPEEKPFVFISEFADSSINLNLYFWVSDINDGRLEPKSDVMLTIWKRFGEAGIEIPFPQRVLHMEKPDEQ